MRAMLCLLALTACGRPPPSPAVPSPSPRSAQASGEAAFLRTAEGIVEIAVPGGARTLHAASDVRWCAVDDRAGVVWLTHRRGEERELAVLDLTGGRELRSIAAIPDVDEIIIEHGEAGQLGGADPVSFRVALAVVVAAPPAVRAVVGCDGDAAVYCYDEDGVLLEQYDTIRRAADAVVLREPALVASLHARSSGRALRPPEAPPAELPRVSAADPATCREIPEDCGAARPLPGTPYWLVVTSNSRGDYFHQSEQLYDPRSREFLDPRTGARSPAPRAGGDVEGLHVSGSGEAFMIEGRVATFDGAVVFEHPGAAPCGWPGGGYRVGGPRE